MNPTLSFYEDHADRFLARTAGADMGADQQRFLSRLPKNAYVLDLGCGSGRDSLSFINAGCRVKAVDGSPAMCKAASALLGQPVDTLLFEDLNFTEAFDGIWACASLLHVPSDRIAGVLTKVVGALKAGGYLYVSVKHGDFEGEREGRFFKDYTEASLTRLFHGLPVAVEDCWLSEELRPDGVQEWIGLIARKR